MSNHIAEQIATVLSKNGLLAFEPVAYYDKHMDCIRVELRDTSFTEERLNEHITFLEDNYPGPNRSAAAGIMFKGVTHFFKKNNLPLEGVVYVTTILNEMVKEYPELAHERICKMVNEMDMTVDMSESNSEHNLVAA
jgi:hypothetical protein